MIAVDSNLLIYAHRTESPWHDGAKRAIRDLVTGGSQWAIPWPCLHEFLAIVTHPRIFKPPTPVDVALAQVDAWLESPTLVMLGEINGYWPLLRSELKESKTIGARVHDARIATICLQHGVESLWSSDRDFGRFSALKLVNPLLPDRISERSPRYRRGRRR